MSARALETVESGLKTVESGLKQVEPVVAKGRERMHDLLTWGQERAPELFRGRRRRSSTGSYVLIGAAAGAGLLALLMGRRAMSGRTVRDVMIRDVQTLPGAATIIEAAQKMRDANVGVLPIVEGDHIRGIVTDRDLVVRGMARGVDPSTTRVLECATTDAISARPEWSVEEAMSVMASQQIGRLPVVDDGGRVVGIVTLSSLALRSGDKSETLDTARQVSLRSARAS